MSRIDWDKDRARQIKKLPREVPPPTTRQLVLITKLCKERGVSVRPVTDVLEASKYIDELFAMPRRRANRTGRVK
jgi:hypothetical protein